MKDIIKRKLHTPRSLDRLTDFSSEELLSPFSDVVCDIKKHNDCPSDECSGCLGFEAMTQLEYDLQTEVILFARQLVKEWKEHSVGK